MSSHPQFYRATLLFYVMVFLARTVKGVLPCLRPNIIFHPDILYIHLLLKQTTVRPPFGEGGGGGGSTMQ